MGGKRRLRSAFPKGDSNAKKSGHQRTRGHFLDPAESGGCLSLHFAASANFSAPTTTWGFPSEMTESSSQNSPSHLFPPTILPHMRAMLLIIFSLAVKSYPMKAT